MWRNYVTVGLRALAKNKVYAFINIFGLAIGLAACLLILLYVKYEESYDDWLANADQVYQLQTFYSPESRLGEAKALQLSAIISGRALAKDFPQVEKVVWVRSFSPIVIQDGQPSEVETLRMADNNLFEVFQVPFVRGNFRTALPDAHSVALSESEARRRFGTADPIGKSLTIVDNTGDVDYRVTAVYKDIPKNSTISAAMVARFDLGTQFADRQEQLTRWGSQQGWNFVRLRKGTDVATINAQLPAWEKRNIPDEVVNGERHNVADDMNLRLVNVADIHLGQAQEFGMTQGNDRGTVTTFAVIAMLVLGMAAINFTNLATARASQRAREVSLRKVLGASRKQLIAQFLGESILLAIIAMVVALALVELALPGFNSFLKADIRLNYFGSGGLWLPIIFLVLLVGIAGGLYPAFYLSRFQPAKILKANKSAADAEGSGRLRNLLVVTQFAISIGLIACTAVIYAQTVFAQTLDSGYQRDGLMQVSNLSFRGVSNDQARSFVERVRRIPGVQGAAGTQIAVSPTGNSMSDFFVAGNPNSISLGVYGVGSGFFESMGMRLLAGRFFSESQGKDDATTPFPVDPAAERALAARGINVVITEAAAKRLGWTPQEAIGKEIRGPLAAADAGLVPCTIVGVVADTRFKSVRDPIQPTVYVMQKTFFSQVAVRYAGVSPADVRGQIEAIWHQLIPLVPFRSDFADDLVREQYEVETARGELFAGFSLLTVIIGCLGLFGLAAFTAERRTKEIGIRKVLGARTRDIVKLLVWQFSRPVIVANIIAWPIAWWLMRDWLNTFDERIPLGLAPFIMAGAIALGIAIATVIGHAVKVARANPIHALRYE